MHELVTKTVAELNAKTITPFLKKTIAKVLTSEYMTRENTLSYAQELVEYTSADAVESFFDSEKILKSITAKDIETRMKELFTEEVLTIGHFIGKK